MRDFPYAILRIAQKAKSARVAAHRSKDCFYFTKRLVTYLLRIFRGEVSKIFEISPFFPRHYPLRKELKASHGMPRKWGNP